jgi:5-formyltetrahydrofolate cyclo-ligase
MQEPKRELRARIRAQRVLRAGDPDGPRARRAHARGLLTTAVSAGLLDQRGRDAVGPVTIAAYLASPDEPDVADIRAAVRAAGGRVLLPIPQPGRALAWAADDDRHVEVTRLRVLAPAGPVLGVGAACLAAQGVGLVLVPALAVDASGTRLGQGGGYYDMLLHALVGSDYAPRILAVVHDDEVLPPGAIPRDAHDVPVPAALTPTGVRLLG